MVDNKQTNPSLFETAINACSEENLQDYNNQMQSMTSKVKSGANVCEAIPSSSEPVNSNSQLFTIQNTNISARESFYEEENQNSGVQSCQLKKPEELNTTPCCVTGLTFGKSSRKVSLPVDPKWGDELYVIADGEEGNRLYAEVESDLIGPTSCLKGKSDRPVAIARTSETEEKGANNKIKVYATKSAGIGDVVPAFQLIKYIYDLIFSDVQPVGTARSHVLSCGDGSVQGSLKVRSFLPVEFGGSVDLSLKGHFGTSGTGGSVTAGGSLKGKIGRQEISFEKRTKDLSGGKKPKKKDIGDESSQFLDLVYEIMTANDSEDDGYRSDTQTGASYVEISHKAEFVLGKLLLAEDGGGPGLNLELEGFKIGFDPLLQLTGRLDIIDVVLMTCATPAVASAVRKIRQRIAGGEAISANVEAYLELTGKIYLDCGLKVELVQLSPLAPSNEKREKVKPDVKGGGKIIGKGLVGLSVKAEGWFLKFDAGINGSLNTSFKYEVKQEGAEPLRQMGFEGLYGKVEAHVKIGISRRKRKRSDDETPDKPTSVSGVNAAGKKEIIAPKMSKWEPFKL